MQVEEAGDLTVVTLPQRVDTMNSPEIEARLKGVLADGARKIVVDCEATEYISSAGLRVLLATLKAVEKSDGRMALCALKPFVAEVFEIAGFSGLFEIVATPDEARALLG